MELSEYDLAALLKLEKARGSQSVYAAAQYPAPVTKKEVGENG